MVWGDWINLKIGCYFGTVILVYAQLNQYFGYDNGFEYSYVKDSLNWFEKCKIISQIIIIHGLPIFSFIFLRKNFAKLTDE